APYKYLPHSRTHIEKQIFPYQPCRPSHRSRTCGEYSPPTRNRDSLYQGRFGCMHYRPPRHPTPTLGCYFMQPLLIDEASVGVSKAKDKIVVSGA
ncbi:unnamed protein product, partial [Musa acuminata subsp. burmannicoides]